MNIFKLLSSPLPLLSNRSLNAFSHREISNKFPFQLFYQDDFKHFSKELPIASTRLRSLILKKHIPTLYTQMTQEKKANPQLTKRILFNIFQIFQTNKINFQQYLILHNHPDTFIHKCDVLLKRIILLSDQNPFPEIYLIEHVLY